MRCAVLLVALAACSAKLDTGASPDAGRTDARPADAPARPPDALACSAGDASATDGTHCFALFRTPAIWTDARTACTALAGGHLAIITSAAENALVAQLAAGHDTFLGATDMVTEGTWLWVDGTPLSYTNWRLGEPSNGGGAYEEDCLVIEGSKTPDDTWDDRPCDPSQVATSGSFPYVCEY